MKNPVIQVINEDNCEIVYSLCVKGTSFRPKVFETGKYTIKVGPSGTTKMRVLENAGALMDDKIRVINAAF